MNSAAATTLAFFYTKNSYKEGEIDFFNFNFDNNEPQNSRLCKHLDAFERENGAQRYV